MKSIKTWAAACLLSTATPSFARLITIIVKPHSETSAIPENAARETEGYRYADAYIDVLAHLYNAETYTDSAESKASEESPEHFEKQWVDYLTIEMSALKNSNHEIEDALAIISPFNKSGRKDIRDGNWIIATCLGGILKNQNKQIQAIISLLNGKPGNVHRGDIIDSATSIRSSEHYFLNQFAQSAGLAAYGMCKPPRTLKDHYERYDFTAAQRAHLKETLESYFGEGVKTLHAGTLYSEAAAAGLYLFLSNDKFKTLDEE